MRIIVVNEKNSLDKNLLNGLKKAGFEATAVPSLADVEIEGQSLPGIFVIGPTTPIEESLIFTEKLTRANPDIAPVLVTEKLSTNLLKQALRAGFRDVVENRSEDIIEIVCRLCELVRPVLQSQTDDRAQTEKEPGKVLTFFSTKGGVGKTVFSTNTAVGLAKQHDKQVILLDLDHHFGDVGVMLSLRPEKTIADLIPAVDRLDVEMLNGLLAQHDSGLKTLLGSTKHETDQRISDTQLKKIIETARRAAEFVIIDTPASFAENTLTILDNSDCIFLVTTLDVPSIKNTQIALQTLKLLNYPMNKIKLLLNRSDSKVSLLPSEVERHLSFKVSVQIPSGRVVPRSVNEGAPLLLENQRSPIVNALNEVVKLAISIERDKAEIKKTSEVSSK